LPVAHATLLSANGELFALLVPDAAAACTTLPAKVALTYSDALHDPGLPTNSTLNLPAGSAPIDLAMRLIPALREHPGRRHRGTRAIVEGRR
jgi:hypothetical protein